MWNFDLQRGGVLIQKWGRSSAASTSVSIVDAIKSLITPTPEGDWFSSGVSYKTHDHMHILPLLTPPLPSHRNNFYAQPPIKRDNPLEVIDHLRSITFNPILF